MLRGQLALGAKIGEELTARNVVHEKVEITGVLREPLETDLRCYSPEVTRNG
jgi:hypothetical protein